MEIGPWQTREIPCVVWPPVTKTDESNVYRHESNLASSRKRIEFEKKRLTEQSNGRLSSADCYGGGSRKTDPPSNDRTCSQEEAPMISSVDPVRASGKQWLQTD